MDQETPGSVEFVYIDRMSPIFQDHFSGESLWAVWDIVVLPTPDEDFEVVFRPPPRHIWLIGPTTPCRASVTGQPRVENAEYNHAATVFLELEGCPNKDWAPVGLVTDARIAQDLVWRPVLSRSMQTPETSGLDDHLVPLARRLLRELIPAGDGIGDAAIRFDFQFTTTVPPVAEVDYGAAWNLDTDGCSSEYTYKTKIGFLRDDQLDSIHCEDCPIVAGEPICAECSYTWLAGAMAKNDEPAIIIFMNEFFEARVLMNEEFANAAALDKFITIPTIHIHDEDRLSRTAPWRCDEDGP